MYDDLLGRSFVSLRAGTHTRGAPTGLFKYPTLFRINPTSRDAFRSGPSRSFGGRFMIGQYWDAAIHGVGNSLTPPSDRVGNSLLDASATMNAYDSIERGAADECEPLRGRRPRTFTLTQLLVACVAVGVCAIAATMVVNTPALKRGFRPNLAERYL